MEIAAVPTAFSNRRASLCADDPRVLVCFRPPAERRPLVLSLPRTLVESFGIPEAYHLAWRRILNEGIVRNSSDESLAADFLLRQEPDEDDEDDDNEDNGRREEEDDDTPDEGYSE